jgi:uncharacterized protein with ParB-like and HNH nuclease domain/predicted transport protein
MKATEAKFLELLRKSPQFVIPIYQRTYSWTERECRQLWDDIIRTGSNDAISAHFVGSIVYIEKGLYQISSQSPMLVIDGQQRLTTITLLLSALAGALDGFDETRPEPIDGFSSRKVRNYYLLNPEEEGERHYKLILSQTDKTTLISVVQGNELPNDYSIRIKENYELFKFWLASCSNDLKPVCKGLAKLVVVDVSLNRDQDNPQLIFESMNSTGRELSQADLIRNYILMGQDAPLQSRLYEQYWRPMEKDFGQDAYTIHFDGFMRHYLTVKTGDIPRVGEVYEAFKAYSRLPRVQQSGVEALVSEIRVYARYFCAMALNTEVETNLKLAFLDLRDLRVDVAYPFLLELYNDYVNNIISQQEFESAVRLIEAYVFRRAICAIPTNSLNKTFATFARALKKDRYLESIQAHLLNLPSYRRFPTDEEFQKDLKTRDLYNFPRRSYWLRRLENHGRKERVQVDEYTVEHIMPQNKDLSTAWQTALGPDWQKIQKDWLHTIGNLTLTGYNSEYSDRSFIEKRDLVGGFKVSPLRLNQDLGQLDVWDEASIKSRADKLANMAIAVWAAPCLPEDVLAAYRPEPQTSSYTINDHPHLLTGTMRELFEAFRKEILALDPCVTEEFLKLYVAYKAETNFVDVVPQARRLRLSLNMVFPDINDPKGMCKDVTGVGRWGNGDVEVGLSSMEELPYVVGLVRQSFDRQMSADD